MSPAAWLRRVTRLPDDPDTHRRRLAVIVRDLLLSALVLVCTVAVLVHPLAEEPGALWLLDLGIAATAVLGLVWLRRGRLRETGILLVIAVWVIELVALVFSGAMDGPALAIWPLLVVCAGLFWSLPAAAWLALASGLAALGVSLGEAHDLLPDPLFPVTAVRQWSGLLGALVMAWVLVHLIQQVQRDTRRDSERSARRYAELVEGSPDGILSLDRQGRVLTANSALRRLLGRDQPLERGAPIGEQAGLDAAQWAPIAEELQAVLQHRPRPPLELSLTRADGRPLEVECKSRPFADEDGRAAVQVTIRDVTARRQAERRRRELELELARSQRLESIGRLSAGIAHDFNNLLTAILGNTELAQDAGPQALQRHLGAITVATRRAAGLCNQMLAYAGRGRFEIGPVDLNDLVGEMGELLGVTLPKGVRLQRDLAPDLPPVRADADQLRQVVMNLITNAAESIDGGEGQVQLTTSRGDRRLPGSEIVAPGPGAADEPPPVRLEVRDTGCGMDAETLARIFDPFFSTKFKGRGLGLAAVQGIVRRLGGGLAVESAPGEGSRFTLLLPVSADDAARSRQRPGTAPRRRRGTALVAEDEPDVRQVIEGLLRQLGLEVLSAGDGRQALELAAGGGALDLAVLDMTMPHLGGAETLPRLRALRPDLPVLLVSGYAAGDVLQRLGRPDGVRFVTKPFTARRFHEAVDALLPAD